MKIGFRKTFERDLKKLRDKTLLVKVKAVIELVEEAETLESISNLKKLRGAMVIFVFVLVTIASVYFWITIFFFLFEYSIDENFTATSHKFIY
jgi:hypothetical protein